MTNAYKQELPLMGNYYNLIGDRRRTLSLDKVLRTMRDHRDNPSPPRIRSDLIRGATRELGIIRHELDKSTYPFARDLADYALGEGESKRVVLVVSGSFIGKTNLRSVIGVDLGSDPHEFYSGSGRGINQTRDAIITQDRTYQFLQSKREELEQIGLQGILVLSSAFYYLRENDLQPFMEGSTINKHKLLPFITKTVLKGNAIGYVGLEEVNIPNSEGYGKVAPVFASYRLKRSLARKIAARLMEKDKIKDENQIADAAAHRIVVATENDVRRLEDKLKSSPSRECQDNGKKTKTSIRVLLTKDCYSKPKENGYKALNLRILVSTTGHPDTVRELQIVDGNQFYQNEIDPNSPTAHDQQAKKETHSTTGVNPVYHRVLEDICGGSSLMTVLLD